MRKRIALFVLPLMLLTGCKDATLTTVSKALNDYAAAIHGVGTTVMQAQAQGIITVDQARPVVELLLKLNQAGQQASGLTRNLTTLPAASKSQLFATLNPVIMALQQAVSSGLVGIPEGATKQNILLGLNTALLALNTIQPLLSASNERNTQWALQASYSC